MAASSAHVPVEHPEVSWLDAEIEVSLATYQAYQVLYYTFIALPLIAGFAKFLHVLAPWESYVSPAIASFLHLSQGAVAILAGFIELMTAAAVALKPRIGSWVVTVWMWLIAVNLIDVPEHAEMVLFTAALSAAGYAFTRLSAECN